MIDKSKPPSRLLWLDLELTGLDPSRDLILEVAALVTDFSFEPLADYQAAIAHKSSEVRALMDQNDWWQSFPETRDQLLNLVDGGKPLAQVESDLIRMVEERFGDEPAVLAGNSIHNDRTFIRQHWPRLEAKLHYRMLDVSSLKVLMQGKYGLKLDKPEVHRAQADILASIKELEFYLDWLERRGS